MINDESVKAVSAARFGEGSVKPLYDSYNFARIPGTVFNALTGENDAALPKDILNGLPARYDKVILLFIDAFGWRFFERHSDHPLLKRFIDSGVVSKLTSQFPSTTAVHYTSIHSGQHIGAHGVVESTYYEPLLDRLIAPLMYSYGDIPAYNSLAGIDAAKFFPTNVLTERLSERGIKSYMFQDRDSYSDLMVKGAHKITPHRIFSEALVNLSEAVISEPGKAYYFLYYGMIDLFGHQYGPSSRQFDAEIDSVLMALERVLDHALAGKAQNTLLLVTADHGQTELSPETRLYIDQLVPNFVPMLRTNGQGEMLAPAGSPRDLFLYLRPECLDEAQAMLAETFKGRAEVRAVRDLIVQGFFGEISDAFLRHAPDLILLPNDHESVWWMGRSAYVDYGYHGGLSANEMETILLARAY